MLELDEVSVGYGRQPVVSRVTLTVGRGEIVGLLGPNGAGKTTLLRGLAGLASVTSGQVRVNGERVRCGTSRTALEHGLVLVSDQRELFPGMSVRDNLVLGAYPRGSRSFHRFLPLSGAFRRRLLEPMEEVVTLFPDLREKLKEPARNLSGGQQQMVAIGRALMSRPNVLLLDEPSAGIAPRLVDQLLATITALAATGMTVLLVEQTLATARAVASRLLLLSQGRLEELDPEELTADALANAYLLGKPAE